MRMPPNTTSRLYPMLRCEATGTPVNKNKSRKRPFGNLISYRIAALAGCPAMDKPAPLGYPPGGRGLPAGRHAGLVGRMRT